MKGVVFSDYDIVKEIIEKTTTTTGLKVVVRLVNKDYPIGIKTAKNEIDFKRIRPHPIIPELAYSLIA